MELIPVWAPNIHPMLIHFPIVLLILAFGLNLITFFVKEKWWDELKTTYIYVLGALSAIVVYFTGEAAANSLFLETGAQSVLTTHADLALITVWYFGIFAAARIALHWYHMFDKKLVQVLAFLIAAPGIFFLFQTGDNGAKLVYGYGAGTGQLLETEPMESFSVDSLDLESVPTSFVMKENGDWTWNMGENSVSELLANFKWTAGSVTALSPANLKANDNYLLQIAATSNPNFFVTNNNYINIQVDIYLNMDSMNGDVKLVHHVMDEQNYDYVSLNSDGSIVQGRFVNGANTVFEESSTTETGMLFVRVVGSGTHFRGYVNQKMAVHGHGDVTTPGAVGLRIEGEGTLLIDKIELTQL